VRLDEEVICASCHKFIDGYPSDIVYMFVPLSVATRSYTPTPPTAFKTHSIPIQPNFSSAGLLLALQPWQPQLSSQPCLLSSSLYPSQSSSLVTPV
jgi:hypothetical protein